MLIGSRAWGLCPFLWYPFFTPFLLFVPLWSPNSIWVTKMFSIETSLPTPSNECKKGVRVGEERKQNAKKSYNLYLLYSFVYNLNGKSSLKLQSIIVQNKYLNHCPHTRQMQQDNTNKINKYLKIKNSWRWKPTSRFPTNIAIFSQQNFLALAKSSSFY